MIDENDDQVRLDQCRRKKKKKQQKNYKTYKMEKIFKPKPYEK